MTENKKFTIEDVKKIEEKVKNGEKLTSEEINIRNILKL
jgi:uncharacterized coiled-coil DUF342 family protein